MNRHIPKSLERSLREHLGNEAELRPLQAAVLDKLKDKKSVFAALPTGYGKSVCYLLPAKVWNWRVLVVSPMIALIEDQAASAKEWGLRVVTLHSQMPVQELRLEENEIKKGNWQILFLSPERLGLWEKNGRLEEFLILAPDLVVFDEFHGLEDWQSYRESMTNSLPAIQSLLLRGATFLALSGSMSETKAKKWMNKICEKFELVLAGLGRENLNLWVVPLLEERQKWFLLPTLLKDLEPQSSAIIYCSTRAETDELQRWLTSLGLIVSKYHAGMPAAERQRVSERFRAGSAPILVATSAFGLGIDYKYVSRVIHFSLPYSIESYWQEVGRGGRGGQESFGIALWTRSEISRANSLAMMDRLSFFQLWRAWSTKICRRSVVARQLELVESDPCGKCDICLEGNLSRVPEWMKALEKVQKKIWWLEDEAQPETWAFEKIFS